METTTAKTVKSVVEHRRVLAAANFFKSVFIVFAVYLLIHNALVTFANHSKIVDRQVAPAADGDSIRSQLLPAKIDNIVTRSDGRLELRMSISISDLMKQMARLHGDDVDGLLMPRETKILLHNPDLCRSEPRLRLIVYVHSAPGNTNRRALIRSTWANKRLFRAPIMRVVFLVGLSASEADQETLAEELARHGDILQGDFRDHYHNLTLKGIMGLRWIAEHCKNAKFALKSDDDAFINIFGYMDVIDGQQNASRMIACTYRGPNVMPILRYPKPCYKWCVKYRDLIGQHHYPGYCAGLSFLLSADIIPAMYEASRSTPFFWVDDVYITGMLPAKAGAVKFVQLGDRMSLSGREAYRQYVQDPPGNTRPYIMVHGLTLRQKLQMWESILRRLRPEQALTIAGDAMANATYLLKHFKPGSI